jgi:putative Holliday junction resolvase
MRVMALDVGFKRIGVALSDPLGLTAYPYRVIYRRSNRETFEELLKIIEDKKVEKVVIGVPVNRQGEITRIGEKIKKFAGKFEEFLKEREKEVELLFWDESFTTQQAREVARELGKRKEEVDDYAAALILKEFLEGLQRNNQ